MQQIYMWIRAINFNEYWRKGRDEKHSITIIMNNTSNVAGHDSIEPFPIIFTWSLLTFVGLAGNSVVIYITCLQSVRSATNTYILNLAVSDIAYLLVVVPFTCLAYIFNHWVFANFGCKLFIFTQYVSRTSRGASIPYTIISLSMFFLTTLSPLVLIFTVNICKQ